MRFRSNLRFAELLFASAFGAKRVGTVSESTEKWDGNSAHVLARRRPRISRPIDRSVPVAAETRREQEGQQHAKIEDGTTRRDEAAKKTAD